MVRTQIEVLLTCVASQPGVDKKVVTLVNGLADCLKSTSNDQNVQQLARELRAAAPELIDAMVVKADA